MPLLTACVFQCSMPVHSATECFSSYVGFAGKCGVNCMQVLHTAMPCIHMQPVHVTDFKSYPHYLCPMYKIPSRRGVLSTTGHSTNFVMDIRVPSDKLQSHWIKRGVALMLSLNE